MLDEPFDASMLVHFRKRISPELLSKINEDVIAASLGIVSEKKLRKFKSQKKDFER